MSKKTITISITILILLIIAGLVSLFFFLPEEQRETFIDFLPFGDDQTPQDLRAGNANQTFTDSPENEVSVEQKMFSISQNPITDFIFIESSSTNTKPSVRFIEQQGLFIKDLDLDTGENQILTGTPENSKNIWWLDKDHFINESEDGTYHFQEILTTVGSSTEYGLQESLISFDLESIFVNSFDWGFVETFSGEGSFYISEQNKLSPQEIGRHPLTDWVLDSSGQDIFSITKPSGVADGYVYKISSGDLFKVAGPLPGLNFNAGTSTTHLISYAQSGGYLLVKLTDGLLQNLGINTFVEKCVFSKTNYSVICAVPKIIPRGIYPDDWYLGKVSFSDDLWKIDLETGEFEKIADLTDLINESIDVSKITITTDDRFIGLQNKIDGRVWVLDLTL